MNGQRYLIAYSAVVTLAFGYTAYRLIQYDGSSHFDELTVGRLNVVESDGTLRAVLSNHAQLPGVIVRGEEHPLDRPRAGMIFFNDEGSEIGGLIFGGHTDADGNIVNSGGANSFDRYEANQTVQLLGVEDSENTLVGLAVSESPSGTEVHRRIWLGRGDDGIATPALKDGTGRNRLLFEVPDEGEPRIVMLDTAGAIVRQVATASR